MNDNNNDNNTPLGAALLALLLDPVRALRASFTRATSLVLFSLVVLCAAVPPIAFATTHDVAAVVTRELRKSGRLDKLTVEQREKLETFSQTSMRVVLPAAAAFKRLLWLWLMTGLCVALARRNNDVAVVQIGGLVALAHVPLCLHDAIATLTFVAKDTVMLDVQNVVQSNAAAWFHFAHGSGRLAALLGCLDVFYAWTLWLLWLALQTLVGKRTSIATTAVLGVALVFVLGSVLVGSASAG